MCETRWASREDSLFTFLTAFSVVVQALESLLSGGDCKARSYLCSIRQFDFIFCLCATKHILSHTVACEGSRRTCALLCEQREFLGSRFYIRTRTRASTHTRWSKSSVPGNRADWHLNSVHKPLLLRLSYHIEVGNAKFTCTDCNNLKVHLSYFAACKTRVLYRSKIGKRISSTFWRRA